MRAFLGICLLAVAAISAASAAPPHYVSQRADLAYLREGPSYDHKILWVYRHRGYPFAVTASFDVWRRVRLLFENGVLTLTLAKKVPAGATQLSIA